MLNPILQSVQDSSFTSRSSNLSYHHVLSTTPLIFKTIGDQLAETANKYPNSLAIASCHQNVELNYNQLYTKAHQLAAAFIHLGLTSQDRIGIYSTNNYEWALTQFAASIADLILVNINPAYQVSELQFVLNEVGCKALICLSAFKSSNYIQMLKEIAPEIPNSHVGKLKSATLPDLKILIKIDDGFEPGFYNFNQLFEMPQPQDIIAVSERMSHIDPDDITNIQFTSGTTGKPKGACLSHFNILNNSYFIGQRLNYTNEDRVCISVPLYHCFGMVIGNLACINYGSAMRKIYPNDAFSAQKTLEAITKYKCTSLYGVPTMFYEYLNEFKKNQSLYNVESLRTGVIAGSLAPLPLMKDIIETLNIKFITNCYGMTETSPVSTQTFLNETWEYKVTTVGTPLPHLEAKIIDSKGATVPYGTPGEYCLRGYSVMKKYWGDNKQTKNCIDKNGFVRSGDLATMNEQGYITIVGRIKDMIIRGGENVYPKEIEDYLMKMEGVEQVQVVGCHDEKFGEEIAALIKLHSGIERFEATQIFEFCSKKIAHYKVPKYVKFVKEFPQTVSGKPQKYKMRDDINEDLKNPELLSQMKIR